MCVIKIFVHICILKGGLFNATVFFTLLLLKTTDVHLLPERLDNVRFYQIVVNLRLNLTKINLLS